MDARKFAEKMMMGMRDIIERGEQPVPVVFLVSKQDKVEIFAIDHTTISKDEMVQVLREKVREPECEFVLWLADAWVAKGKAKTPPPGGVKTLPGAMEAITGTIYSMTGRSVQAQWRYGRDPKKTSKSKNGTKRAKPVFQEIEWIEKEQDPDGRFSPANIVGRKA